MAFNIVSLKTLIHDLADEHSGTILRVPHTASLLGSSNFEMEQEARLESPSSQRDYRILAQVPCQVSSLSWQVIG
jgi:hypothetical protein